MTLREQIADLICSVRGDDETPVAIVKTFVRPTAERIADEIIALVRGDAEPVAWRWRSGFDSVIRWRYSEYEPSEQYKREPLYASPPPVEVTDQQITLVSMTLGINPTRENVRSALRAAGIQVEREK